MLFGNIPGKTPTILLNKYSTYSDFRLTRTFDSMSGIRYLNPRLFFRLGVGLRHRQRQHRHLRFGSRRGFWRRKGNRGRPGIRFRCLEGLYAPTDQHHQLRENPALGPGYKIRHLTAHEWEPGLAPKGGRPSVEPG